MTTPTIRHAKSTANPDWPYESYCVGCGLEWEECERNRAELERREAMRDWRNDAGV